MPPANTLNASYQGTQGQVQYAQMVSKYGKETADKLATQTYVSTMILSPSIATNTDNQYLQNENAAITNAEKRQQEFVNNNSFMANPQPQATAPIPNVITVSTPLYRQAGEKENPLTILEGINLFLQVNNFCLKKMNSLRQDHNMAHLQIIHILAYIKIQPFSLMQIYQSLRENLLWTGLPILDSINIFHWQSWE